MGDGKASTPGGSRQRSGPYLLRRLIVAASDLHGSPDRHPPCLRRRAGAGSFFSTSRAAAGARLLRTKQRGPKRSFCRGFSSSTAISAPTAKPPISRVGAWRDRRQGSGPQQGGSAISEISKPTHRKVLRHAAFLASQSQRPEGLARRLQHAPADISSLPAEDRGAGIAVGAEGVSCSKGVPRPARWPDSKV